MRQSGLPVVCVVLVMCTLGALPDARAASPAEQVAQSGLPLLTEFTLRPGDPAFVYLFTAPADGPWRVMAWWGATVDVELAVHPEGAEPAVQRGNPASIRFAAVKGARYRIAVRAAQELPVTSVGQLLGGPEAETGQAIVEAPTTTTPVSPQGPQLQSATPMPLPGPAPPELAPLPAGVVERLAMPLDLGSLLRALGAQPEMATPLAAVVGGGAGGGQATGSPGTGGQGGTPGSGTGEPDKAPGAGVLKVGALVLPGSTEELGWRSGLQLRPWSEGPSYWCDGTKYAVAAMFVHNARLEAFPQLMAHQAKGIVLISTRPHGQVVVHLELPRESATYAIVLRTADAKGTVQPTWASEEPRRVRLRCLRPWLSDPDFCVELPLTPCTSPTGFATVMAVAPPAEIPSPPVPPTTLGMRRPNVTLCLDYAWGEDQTGTGEPMLFAGIDIIRLG